MRVETPLASSVEARLRNQARLLDLAQLRPSTVDEALTVFLRTAGETLGVERSSYWSLTADGAAITCEKLHLASAGTFQSGGRLDAATYPAYFEALRGLPRIVAHDAVNDPETREFANGYFDAHGIGAMLDVPVWRDGRIAGVLCHEHVGPARTWSIDEQDFAHAVANLLALGLETLARTRAEERFRLAARATGEVIWQWDFATDEVSWTDSLREAFGFDVGGVTTADWWRARVHPGDRDRIVSSTASTIASGDSSWSGEYRFAYADGRFAHVRDRGFVTRTDAGAPLRMTGSMQDVTDRKALESRLILADRLASIGILAAGVAHEINNPLAYILGNLDYALDALASTHGVDSDVLGALRDAHLGTQRITRIVADLKPLSRAQDDAAKPVDVDAVVRSSLAIGKHQIQRRGAALVVELGAPPPARATEARLGQVVLNLLVNAAQALEGRDGDALEVRIRTGTAEDGFVYIEVTDTGCGIPPAVLTRIFDPFYTTKPAGEGTGLGLSICHTIVTSFGGDILVDTDPHTGTTFRVLLPRAEGVLDEERARTPPAVSARLRVLVIDDDANVLTVVERLLGEHDVSTCSNAREGLQRALTERFDVIVCDVVMPDLSGVAVFERAVAERPELARRFLFCSGGGATQAEQDGLVRTSQPLLEKPFDAVALRSAIFAVGRAPAS